MEISLHSFKLALGLDWAMAMSKSEVASHVKRMGKGPVVVLPDAYGQFFVGHYAEPCGSKTYAAAALVGLLVRDAIVSQTVSDEKTWMCVLQDGNPLPDHDRIYDREEAREQLRGLMAIHRHLVYGDASGAQETVEEVLQRVRQAVADKSISKQQLKRCELKPRGVSMSHVLTLVLLAGLAACGYIGFKQWKHWQTTQRAMALNAEKARAADMTEEQIEAERRRLTAKFHADVAARRAEIDAGSRPGQAAPMFASASAVRRALPLSKAGYFPVSIKCIPAECSIEWAGQGRFTLASHKQQITGRPSYDTSLTANTTHALPASTPAQAPSREAPYAVRLALVESLARTPGIKVDAPQPVVIAPPQGVAGLNSQTVGYVGDIQATIQSTSALIVAEHVVHILNKFPVTLTSIEFTGVRQSPSVTLVGRYWLPMTIY